MITLITDKILIGDYLDGKQIPNSVDAVLNVALELDITTVGNEHRHKVGLIDGPGNDDFTLMAAVIQLHSLNKKYRRVLLHCMAGQSRSVMVAAVYVSIIGGFDFDTTLHEIMKNRGASQYRPVLYQQYRQLIPKLKSIIIG